MKDIKLDVLADFIHKVSNGIIITTNKVVAASDLKTIKKYLQSVYNLDSIKSSYSPMSKLYLKIIKLLYILEQTNFIITSELIEKVIKETHIFNDIILVLKPYIIKVSPKSDIAVIWINIWDSQSGAKAKMIINQQFNISQYIATIYGTNINPNIS